MMLSSSNSLKEEMYIKLIGVWVARGSEELHLAPVVGGLGLIK